MEIYAYSGMYKERGTRNRRMGWNQQEEAEQECGKRMEYKLSEKNGVVMAVVPEGVNKERVEELLELLAKSYHMRTHTRETEEREVPIICGL